MKTINYKTYGLIREGNDTPSGGDIADLPLFNGVRGLTTVSGPVAFDDIENAKAFRDEVLIDPENYRIIVLTGTELDGSRAPDSEG